MDMTNQVQILDQTVCSSQALILLGKVWIHLLSLQGSLTLAWQPVQEKENSEITPDKLHLKINLVLHPGCMKGLDEYIL